MNQPGFMSLPAPVPSFENWIEKARNGEEALWVDLYKKVFPKIQHLICTNSGSRDQAKDLLQDSLITLYEKIRDGKLVQLTCQPETYLYSVVRNKWLEHRKRQGNFLIRDLEAEDIADLSGVDWQDEPIAYDELLQNAIARLDEKCRQLILQTEYHGIDMTAIAAQLGYENAHVASNMKYRCLQKLKKLVQIKNQTS